MPPKNCQKGSTCWRTTRLDEMFTTAGAARFTIGREGHLHGRGVGRRRCGWASASGRRAAGRRAAASARWTSRRASRRRPGRRGRRSGGASGACGGRPALTACSEASAELARRNDGAPSAARRPMRAPRREACARPAASAPSRKAEDRYSARPGSSGRWRIDQAKTSVNRIGPIRPAHRHQARVGALQPALLGGRRPGGVISPLMPGPHQAHQREHRQRRPSRASPSGPVAYQAKPDRAARTGRSRARPARRSASRTGGSRSLHDDRADARDRPATGPPCAGVPAVAVRRCRARRSTAAPGAPGRRGTAPPASISRSRWRAVEPHGAQGVGVLQHERRAPVLRQRLRQHEEAVEPVGQRQRRRRPERPARVVLAEQPAQRAARG